MSRVIRLLVTGALIFLIGFSWLAWSSGQAMLRRQLETIAGHAAGAADAYRILADDPTDQYERYRALNQARSFISESASLMSQQRVKTALTWGEGTLPLPIQALIDGRSGESDRSDFRLTSQSLFAIEKMLGQLANPEARRLITHRDLTRAFTDIAAELSRAGK